jgi:hypothetical protein
MAERVHVENDSPRRSRQFSLRLEFKSVMKRNLQTTLLAFGLVWLGVGCASTSRGLGGGTVPYEVKIETSESGSRIEVDGEVQGRSPLTVTIWGDKDGTFHGSGDGHTVFRAFPVREGQFVQTKRFLNGAQQFMFGQEDRIPKSLYFDLNQKPEGLEIIAPK